MTKKKKIKIIYIVGPPRSGTTLLHRIIGSSIKGNEIILPECHSLTSTLKEFEEIINYTDNNYINRNFGSKKKLIALFKNIVTKKIDHIIEINKKKINQKMIILKDPEISYYLKSLNLLRCENSYLVLLLRNPLFVIDRLIEGQKRTNRSYNFFEIVKHAFLFYYKIDSFMRLNKNFFFIRYEDIIKKDFNKLEKFLSIKFLNRNYLKIKTCHKNKKTLSYSAGFSDDIDKKYNLKLINLGLIKEIYIKNRFRYFINKYFQK